MCGGVSAGVPSPSAAGLRRSRPIALLLLITGALLALTAPPALAAQDTATTADRRSSTIADLLLSDEEFGTFTALVEEAGLMALFRGPYPTTLFAPRNEAFEALDEGRLERLRSSPEALERFIRFHVLEDDIIIASGGRLASNGALNPIERVLFMPDPD